MVTPISLRRAVVVAGCTLLAATAVYVMVRWTDSRLVRSAGWGTVVTWREWEPVAPWLPGVRVPRKKRMHFGAETAWVALNLPMERMHATCARVVGRCGCRFVGSLVPVGPGIWAWQPLPSLGAAVDIDVELEADGREQRVTIERPSPVAARVASPDRPVLPLPWSGEVLGERIELSESDGTVLVRWRPVGESPPRPMARDYDGRSAEVPRKIPNWERWSDLPFGTLLCPHGPWWEIEFSNAGGEPTVLRFACPTVPTAPK